MNESILMRISEPRRKRLANISLIMGTVALIGSFTGIIGVALGILSIVAGAKSNQAKTTSKSVMGIILGSIGLFIGIATFVYWATYFTTASLQQNIKDQVRKESVGRISSMVADYKLKHNGSLPELRDVAGLELTDSSIVIDEGSPKIDTIVYKSGVDCTGTLGVGLYSVSTLLEDGEVFCWDF